MIIKNRHLLFFFSLLISLATLPLPAQEGPKVAIVDMGKLLNEFNETLALRTESEAERKKLDEKNSERLEPITKIASELEATIKLIQGNTLSEQQKLAKRQEGAQKEQILMGLQRERKETIERGMKAIQDNLVTKMAGIRIKVAAAVEKYAEEEGYNYVFDSTGQSTNLVPFVLYIRNKTDITEDVLGVINASATPAPTPEPAPTPAPAE